MAYIVTPGFAGFDLTATGSEKLLPLGTEVQGSDGNTWIYTQVDGSERTSGESYYLDSTGAVRVGTQTSTLAGGAENVVFLQHTIGANEYGWAVSKGIDFLAQPLSGSADTKLYTSANFAFIDDDPTGHELIAGVRGNAAATGGDISCSSAGYPEVNTQD